MTSRRAQKAPRLAPPCRGHEETKRLAATHAAVDLDRLLQAIRLAEGPVVTAARGQKKNEEPSLESTSDQQVGSAEPQLSVPRFPELAPELRVMIWQRAMGPRLIYVHFGPYSNPPGDFESNIMNRKYLEETEDRRKSLLLTCKESNEEVHRAERMDESREMWLKRLCLTRFHPTAADFIYMGGLDDFGCAPPWDMNKIIPLSLVLGNILPRVMVNADVFVEYFKPDPNGQPENPIQKALADLRALEDEHAPIFDDNSDGLPQPRLPESMVFMLDNLPLQWVIASPCRVPGHTAGFEIRRCIHYDHLEIVAEEDVDNWMDANLVQYDDNSFRDRRNWRTRMEIVPAVRAIFAGWRSRPDVTRPPRLFFARIKPSE